MKRRLAAAALAAALALGLPQAAAPAPLAADSSAQVVVAHFSPEEAAHFSKQVERDLAARGARVALVFRTGRPREDLPDGIAYTHGAFWIYRAITTSDGQTRMGYAVYNLYAGDGRAWPLTESRLVQDYPLDFTRGSTVDDMAVIIPRRALQERLLALVDTPAYARLHNPEYSLTANPWRDRFQNCNTFMLDVLASALWREDNPQALRALLRARFEPAVIRPNPLVRLFGPFADPRLRTGDQRGPIRTATFETIRAFLHQQDQLEASYVVSIQR